MHFVTEMLRRLLWRATLPLLTICLWLAVLQELQRHQWFTVHDWVDDWGVTVHKLSGYWPFSGAHSPANTSSCCNPGRKSREFCKTAQPFLTSVFFSLTLFVVLLTWLEMRLHQPTYVFHHPVMLSISACVVLKSAIAH